MVGVSLALSFLPDLQYKSSIAQQTNVLVKAPKVNYGSAEHILEFTAPDMTFGEAFHLLKSSCRPCA